MNAVPVDAPFVVRFDFLSAPGRALAFPCDAGGRVDLDALSERARNDYLFARALVGRVLDRPRVCPLAAAASCRRH